MNLNSTILHLDIAKVGKGFLVKCTVTHMPANGGTSTSYGGDDVNVFLKSPEELMAWLASLESKVR